MSYDILLSNEWHGIVNCRNHEELVLTICNCF